MYEEILKKANECLEANEDLELVEMLNGGTVVTSGYEWTFNK